jgi:cyclopropane-fatty-acyl-phospholipid synthase
MTALAFNTWSALRETFFERAYPPVVALARRSVIEIFSALDKGSLLIKDDCTGAEHAFGRHTYDEEEPQVKSVYTIPPVKIIVKRDSFWLRLFLFADMGFAEGYMLGDFQCNDLSAFFRVRTYVFL